VILVIGQLVNGKVRLAPLRDVSWTAYGRLSRHR